MTRNRKLLVFVCIIIVVLAALVWGVLPRVMESSPQEIQQVEEENYDSLMESDIPPMPEFTD